MLNRIGLLFICLLMMTTSAQTDVPIVITPQNATQLDMVARIGDGYVFEILQSPTGDTLAVMSSLGIWIYDLSVPDSSPFLLDTIPASMTYSPDGQFIATATEIWHIATRKIVQTINTPFFLTQEIVYSPDGQFIAIHDGFDIQFVSVQTGEPVYQLNLTDDLYTFAYHPSGEFLAIGFLGNDVGISLWQISDTQFSADTTITPIMDLPLPEHESRTWDVSFSGDGSKVIGMSESGVVAVWNVADGTLLNTFDATLHEYDILITDYQIHPTQEMFYVTDARMLRVWSFDGELRHEIPIQHMWDATYSYDGATMYILDVSDLVNTQLLQWDLTTNTLATSLPTPDWGQMNFISFAPDGETFAIAYPYELVVYSASTYEPVATFSREKTLIGQFDYHPTNQQIALYAVDTQSPPNIIITIVIWDIAQNTVIQEWAIEQVMNQLVYSPDGQFILGNDVNQNLHIWDVASQTEFISLPQDHSFSQLSYSPDGTRILTTRYNSGDITILDSQTGDLISEYTTSSPAIRDLVYHNDGTHLSALSDDNILYVWDARTDDFITFYNLNEIASAYRIAYSPDDQLLAIGTTNGDILLLNNGRIATLHTLTGHQNTVDDLAFSPDGTQLFSFSRDDTVRVWAIPQ